MKLTAFLLAFSLCSSAYGQNTYPWPQAGDIGIQTSSPQGTLHIGSIRPVVIKANGGYGVYGSEIGFNAVLNTSVTPNTFRKFGSTGQKGGASIVVDYEGSMLFQTYNADTESESIVNFSPQVVFKNNGNVGIGTTSPDAPLDVKGRQVYFGNIPVTIGHSGDDYPSIGYNTSYTNSASSFLYKISDKASLIHFGSGGFSFRTAPAGTAGGPISFTEVLTIAENGNVSIGTTDSKGFRLAVNGKAIAEEIVVKLHGNWPDYVFEDGHILPSLLETEQYIIKNHHLPEVPTAQDIENGGLNLGEMNALLLKKVEELTLYLIEQKKQLDSQQQEITALKLEISKK